MPTSVSRLAAKRGRVQGILPTSPARQGEFGTYFTRSPRTIEQMLQNMGLGLTPPRAIVCPAKGWRAALAIPSAAAWTLRPAGGSKIRKAGMVGVRVRIHDRNVSPTRQSRRHAVFALLPLNG
jgi:hypothetical protein